MKLKLSIIIASIMHCMPNAAMNTQPTYLQMANKEIEMMAQDFKKRFQLISNLPIEILETIEMNCVWHRYIRINNSDHVKPLCNVDAVISKHNTFARAILASICQFESVKILWIEHNHDGTPFMMPYYRRDDNRLMCLIHTIDPILKKYATKTPLSQEATKILDDARAEAKKAAREKALSEKAHAFSEEIIKKVRKEMQDEQCKLLKDMQEQENGLLPVAATRVQLLDNAAAAIEMDAKRNREDQAKVIDIISAQTQIFSAACNSAIATVSPAIACPAFPANAAKPTEQSKDCCIQ